MIEKRFGEGLGRILSRHSPFKGGSGIRCSSGIRCIIPVTQKAEYFLDSINLDQFLREVLDMLVVDKVINAKDYDRIFFYNKKIKEADKVYSSNPVFFIDLDESGRNKVVLKINPSEGESAILQYFSTVHGIASPDFVSSRRINVDGSSYTVLMTRYLEGSSLSDIAQQNGKGKIGSFRQAVQQLARIQVRGLQGERDGVYTLVDAVSSPDYFTTRVNTTFLTQFGSNAREFLDNNSLQAIAALQKEISTNYGAVNRVLSDASAKDCVYYADAGPNNFLISDNAVRKVDFGSNRKLTGMIDLISLLEFGRKDMSEWDFLTEKGEYLSEKEKTSLLHQYLLERFIEETSDCAKKEQAKRFLDYIVSTKGGDFMNWRDASTYLSFVSEKNLLEAERVKKYAAMHRHLEYVGYAQRDISEASPEEKRNEFNRQRYHLRKAIKYLNELVFDSSLDRNERSELFRLKSALTRISSIIERQKIPSQYLEYFAPVRVAA